MSRHFHLEILITRHVQLRHFIFRRFQSIFLNTDNFLNFNLTLTDVS